MNYYKATSGYSRGVFTCIVIAEDEEAALKKFRWFLQYKYPNSPSCFVNDATCELMQNTYGVLEIGWEN